MHHYSHHTARETVLLQTAKMLSNWNVFSISALSIHYLPYFVSSAVTTRVLPALPGWRLGIHPVARAILTYACIHYTCVFLDYGWNCTMRKPMRKIKLFFVCLFCLVNFLLLFNEEPQSHPGHKKSNTTTRSCCVCILSSVTPVNDWTASRTKRSAGWFLTDSAKDLALRLKAACTRFTVIARWQGLPQPSAAHRPCAFNFSVDTIT